MSPRIPKAGAFLPLGAALAIVILSLASCLTVPVAAADEGFLIRTPGLAPSRVDPQGRLVEDWGAVALALDGEALAAWGPKVEEIRIGPVPAVRAAARKGAARVEWTAYRAPSFPAGVDVLSVRLAETDGREARAVLSLELPAGARIGARTVSIGGRTILALPRRTRAEAKLLEWGYDDEATSLPGWARPEGECDPAFRNIRAGLDGVPIVYRFSVTPGSAASVVLGFCESHWASGGQRPVIASVEGAPPQEVDPVARWGQHRPGAILFAARDAATDGTIEISVLPKVGAPDVNPILNAIWIFPAGSAPNLEAVVAGKLNDQAIRRVDVGGEDDQSIYPPGKIEYELELAPRGSETLDFLVACPGGSAPFGERTTWTAESLLEAARAVWTDWKEP